MQCTKRVPHQPHRRNRQGFGSGFLCWRGNSGTDQTGCKFAEVRFNLIEVKDEILCTVAEIVKGLSIIGHLAVPLCFDHRL
jgi:hypothetical protein